MAEKETKQRSQDKESGVAVLAHRLQIGSDHGNTIIRGAILTIRTKKQHQPTLLSKGPKELEIGVSKHNTPKILPPSGRNYTPFHKVS